MNKTDLLVCEAISLLTMCVKFCLNVGEQIVLGVKNVQIGSRIWYFKKMIEIKVA